MDFIDGLPKLEGKGSILVVVNRLTKYGHFMGLSHPYSASQVARVFMDSVYKLHSCSSRALLVTKTRFSSIPSSRSSFA